MWIVAVGHVVVVFFNYSEEEVTMFGMWRSDVEKTRLYTELESFSHRPRGRSRPLLVSNLGFEPKVTAWLLPYYKHNILWNRVNQRK